MTRRGDAIVDFTEETAFDWSNVQPFLCPRTSFSDLNTDMYCSNFPNYCNCYLGINVIIHMD